MKKLQRMCGSLLDQNPMKYQRHLGKLHMNEECIDNLSQRSTIYLSVRWEVFHVYNTIKEPPVICQLLSSVSQF